MENNFLKIRKVLFIVLFLNWGVALLKIILGYFTGSLSITADGFHSFSDGASNIIGIVGIFFAMKPVDSDHPYGHKKIENFTALGIVMLLMLVCFEVLQNALQRFFNPATPEINILSFAVMIFTLVVNIFVVKYEKKKGKELKSDILIADSCHTTSDIYVTLSVIFSLFAVRMGFPIMDTIASVVVVAFIAHAIYQILSSDSQILVDSARIDPKKLENFVLGIEGICGCHKIRSRGREDDIYVDMHVFVDKKMKIDDAHALSHSVGNMIKKEFNGVSDVIIHVEPFHQ